jgi:hypothetical protein
MALSHSYAAPTRTAIDCSQNRTAINPLIGRVQQRAYRGNQKILKMSFSKMANIGAKLVRDACEILDWMLKV